MPEGVRLGSLMIESPSSPDPVQTSSRFPLIAPPRSSQVLMPTPSMYKRSPKVKFLGHARVELLTRVPEAVIKQSPEQLMR